jgi:CTP:molybdopterin cytidylyltransferase MocA
MTALAIVPAAGSGRRFGHSLKLLAPIDGVPMLERTLRSLLDAGVDPVIVVVSPQAELTAVAALGDPRVGTAVNPDPSRGMFSSIQAGAQQAYHRIRPGSALLVMPADMPFVAPETIARVIAACLVTGRIVCPSFGGARGHPVVMPGALLDRIREAPAGATLAEVLDAEPSGRMLLPVTDRGVVRDVDVPRDL